MFLGKIVASAMLDVVFQKNFGIGTHLIETARPVMQALVEEATGISVVSLHHDISTVTGEEVLLFTLAQAVTCRDAKKT